MRLNAFKGKSSNGLDFLSRGYPTVYLAEYSSPSGIALGVVVPRRIVTGIIIPGVVHL